MTHEQCQELLPWYSTLDDSLRLELDAHLKSCRECEQEFAEVRQLRNRITSQKTPEPSAFLLQRTLNKIEAFESEKPEKAGWWNQFLHWWRLGPISLRTLVVAQGVLVILFIAGIVYVRQVNQNYTTLSGPPAAASGIRLTISFRPGTSEQSFRDAISSMKGNIVGGPSALGLYTVEVPRNSNIDQTLSQLRENPNVQFVQRNPDQP